MTSDSIMSLAQIEQLLHDAHVQAPIQNLEEYLTRQQQYRSISGALMQVQRSFEQLNAQFRRLPPLPPEEEITWAQATRAFPNLAYLEVDTTGVRQDAEIVRLLLVDAQGDLLFDRFIKPPVPLSPEISRINGIAQQAVEQAASFTEVWPQFLHAVTGHFLLSFNLEFDLSMVQSQLKRLHLPAVTLIGACLMEHGRRYFRTDNLKLSVACERLGKSLPPIPGQTAMHRAEGQRDLHQAMTKALTGPQSDVSIEDDFVLDDSDEFP